MTQPQAARSLGTTIPWATSKSVLTRLHPRRSGAAGTPFKISFLLGAAVGSKQQEVAWLC